MNLPNRCMESCTTSVESARVHTCTESARVYTCTYKSGISHIPRGDELINPNGTCITSKPRKRKKDNTERERTKRGERKKKKRKKNIREEKKEKERRRRRRKERQKERKTSTLSAEEGYRVNQWYARICIRMGSILILNEFNSNLKGKGG